MLLAAVALGRFPRREHPIGRVCFGGKRRPGTKQEDEVWRQRNRAHPYRVAEIEGIPSPCLSLSLSLVL